MTDRIQTHIRACKCGHDETTHYKDSKGYGNCLGRGCDCAGYHDKDAPGAYVKQPKDPAPIPPRFPW